MRGLSQLLTGGVAAGAGFEGGGFTGDLRVVVTEVELEAHRSIVQLTMVNYTKQKISYDHTDASLTDEGRRYPPGPLTLGLQMQPGKYDTDVFPALFSETLKFDPIPLEARRLRLTLGRFGNDKFSVAVPIVLYPTFACP